MIKCNENGRGGKLVHAKKYWGHARSVQDTDQTQQQTGKKKSNHAICVRQKQSAQNTINHTNTTQYISILI